MKSQTHPNSLMELASAKQVPSRGVELENPKEYYVPKSLGYDLLSQKCSKFLNTNILNYKLNWENIED